MMGAPSHTDDGIQRDILYWMVVWSGWISVAGFLVTLWGMSPWFPW